MRKARANDAPENVGTLSKVNHDGSRDHLGDFALESPTPPGDVPQRVVDELVTARTHAKDHAQAFSDAVNAQAEKYKVKPSALKKYVCAIEADKVGEAAKECEHLARLIEHGQ